ncbi:MAG TPA: hypothetical protein VFP14_12135 [Novosphingobium sp.]|nr:hypothetical protein [Novosphingobium sp.]
MRRRSWRNRTLKAMQARGLLVWGRGGVAVRNWDRLEDVAEFDRRYLHLRTEPAFC